MPIDGNKFQILRWPFIKMRLRPWRLLGRQRPIVEQLSERWKPTVLLILEKQSPALCRTCPFHPTIACRGYAMSGNGSHGREGERLPLLPNHLWNGITGLLPQKPMEYLMAPLHLLMGNMPLATLSEHSLSGSLPLGRNLPLVISHTTTPAAPQPSLGMKLPHHSH